MPSNEQFGSPLSDHEIASAGDDAGAGDAFLRCDLAWSLRNLGGMDDLEAMAAAMDEARLALAHGDVPIGAVVVAGGEIVARRHNEREATNDPTAHAEVLALRDAATIRGSWRLDDATLVVTLEPCAMCAGAAVNARIARVVFGARDLKAGALGSLYQLGADPRLNHEYEVVGDVMAEACGELLTSFFAGRR
jgi:tRNA(adenine34) deaminase